MQSSEDRLRDWMTTRRKVEEKLCEERVGGVLENLLVLLCLYVRGWRVRRVTETASLRMLNSSPNKKWAAEKEHRTPFAKHSRRVPVLSVFLGSSA